ncbi:unnamed protein product [Lactuca saligna]|uniref:Uncharacterized protein n=1 Tax=Lactuca saligna TaxID=75948 RepID=A0AA35Z5N7_LACSI|nr:unnamed protein product [Lactuca saligna]
MHPSSNNGASGSKLRGKSIPTKVTLSSAFKKENSSDDEAKYLMGQVIEFHTDTSHDSDGILNANSLHTVDDLKLEWDDASEHQVKNHVNLSSIDDDEPFDRFFLAMNFLGVEAVGAVFCGED